MCCLTAENLNRKDLNILSFKVETHSLEETNAAAREFAASLKAGTAVGLAGTLGSGKTTFAKGILSALHVDGCRFQGSPTFTLVQEYREGRVPIYHFDFYRLKNAEEIYDIGWDDYCAAGGVILVEWADRFADVMPEKTRWLRFEILDENSRTICESENSSS